MKKARKVIDEFFRVMTLTTGPQGSAIKLKEECNGSNTSRR